MVSLAGLIQGAPGGMIIPLNGADPAVLAKVVNPHGNPPPADPNDPNAAQQARMMPQTAVVGDNIVFSTGSGLEKMKTPSTEPRQDLTDGLAAGGDSTVHLVLTPATLKNNPLFAAIVNSRMGGQNGARAVDSSVRRAAVGCGHMDERLPDGPAKDIGKLHHPMQGFGFGVGTFGLDQQENAGCEERSKQARQY